MPVYGLPEPLSDEDFEQVVSDLVDEAARHVDERIRPQREDIWRRYYGFVNTQPTSGGSDLVVTAIQDSVLTLLPDLLALFMGTDRIVEFLPESSDPGEMAVAIAASDAAIALFWQQNGFKSSHDALHEGVTTGYGFFKVYRKAEIEATFSQENHDELSALARSQSAQMEHMGNGQYNVTQYRTNSQIWIDSVAASNIIWAYADDFDNSTCIGEVVEVTLGDLRKLGFEPEELDGLSWDDASSSHMRSEQRARENNLASDSVQHWRQCKSWALQKVSYYELYCQIDKDGDGIPEYYKVLAAGSGKKVLRYQRVSSHPYVMVPAYPVPNSAYSQGVGQKLAGLQEAETYAGRALVDDTDMSASPVLMVARAARVDPEQIAVWKKHKIIDCEMPEGVKFFAQESHQGEITGIIEYLKKMREDRVGISQIAAGLDIESISEITATLARGVLSAAQRKIDYIARIIAEKSFVKVFAKLLPLMIEDKQIMVNMNGQMIAVDTTNYNPNWKLRPKVGLGISSRSEKQSFYQLLYQTLSQICAQLGPDNAITDVAKVRQIIVDYGATNPGIDINRYVKSAQECQQAMEQAKQQPPPPDPKMVAVQQKAQADQANMELKARQAQAEMQRKAQQDQQKAQLDYHTMQQKADIQLATAREQMQMKREQAQAEYDLKQQEALAEHQRKLQELHMEALLKGVELQQEFQLGKQQIDVNANLKQVN